jgi:hypothetical protein
MFPSRVPQARVEMPDRFVIPSGVLWQGTFLGNIFGQEGSRA